MTTHDDLIWLREGSEPASSAARFGRAARLAVCGISGPWVTLLEQHDPAQRDALVRAVADEAGKALSAAVVDGGAALARALVMAQDCHIAAVLLDDLRQQPADEQVTLSVEACREAAEEIALDAVARELVEDWWWRRLVPEDLLLASVAHPISAWEMLATLPVVPASVDPPCGFPCDSDSDAVAARECGVWNKTIRALEDEALREHFAEAWRWTALDIPLHQLTWGMYNQRRTVRERCAYLHALARWGHPFGWHVVMRHARRGQEQDPEMRRQACLALNWTGRAGLAVLQEVVRDQDEDLSVRQAAARSLLILINDPVAQELAAQVGYMDREDRRLRAVAAVAGSDPEHLALLALDGFGAPELPRWGLAALHHETIPSHEHLTHALLEPVRRGAEILLALPGWSVRHGPELVAAVDTALRICIRAGRTQMPGLILRAMACLDDQALDQWRWCCQQGCQPSQRIAITLGLLGDTMHADLASCLRTPEGAEVLITTIGNRGRAVHDRDRAVKYLVLHRRLHPQAPYDVGSLRKNIRRCVADANTAEPQQEKALQSLARGCAWMAGVLHLPGTEQIISQTWHHNRQWAPWALEELGTQDAIDILSKWGAEEAAEIQNNPLREVYEPIMFSLAKYGIDVGPGLLRDDAACMVGYWRYAIARGGDMQRDRMLDRAPTDVALAYRVMRGLPLPEACDLHHVMRAWRHLEGSARRDLTIKLLPALFERSPDTAFDRIADLGEHLGSATVDVIQEILAAEDRLDRRLVLALRGLATTLRAAPVALPIVLRDLLYPEEVSHLSFAGRQLSTDDGKVRGSGVIALAQTFEVACRHHVAPHLEGPLRTRLSQEGGCAEQTAVAGRLRKRLDAAGLQQVEDRCFRGQVGDVLHAVTSGHLTSPRSGKNRGLGFWATALALAYPPDHSPEPFRHGLRSMWALQQRRNHLVHDLDEVGHDEAGTWWTEGTHAMPVVLQRR